jgi:hypothetical protein
MDDPCYESEHERIYSVFLLTLWYSEYGDDNPADVGALVLQPCETGNEQFRRLGYATPEFVYPASWPTDWVCWIDTVLRMHDEAELRVIEIG